LYFGPPLAPLLPYMSAFALIITYLSKGAN